MNINYNLIQDSKRFQCWILWHSSPQDSSLTKVCVRLWVIFGCNYLHTYEHKHSIHRALFMLNKLPVDLGASLVAMVKRRRGSVDALSIWRGNQSNSISIITNTTISISQILASCSKYKRTNLQLNNFSLPLALSP